VNLLTWRWAGLVCGLLLLASPAHADGLIDNVNGYTLDAEGKLERFTGLMISAEGKVSKLLDKRDKRPERLDFKLDAQGRTLIPGFVGAEGRVMRLGLSALRLDLSGLGSLAEAQAKLKAYAEANPGLRWIVGYGWDARRWGRLPDATDIDAAVPDRPAWLEAADGGAALANSAALAAAGGTAKTSVPPGGRIVGKGLLVGRAMELVASAVPPPLPRERDAAVSKAQDRLLAAGITTVADMGTTPEDWNSYRRAGDTGRLKVRIISYAAAIDPLVSIAGTGPTPWLYGDRLRMIGLALETDGALSTRGAWLKRGYADAPAEHGLSLLDDAKLRNLASRAAMDGFQVAIEATGDAAADQALGAIEELALTYKGDRRWRIEGPELVDPTDAARFARNGIIVSTRPGWSAWRPIADAGATLALASNPDPLSGIATALAAGATAERALEGFTIGAARAGFAEDRLGTLAPGRLADFLILDRDIFAPAQDIAGGQVMETWVGGRRAWVRK
jgi:predicted amidohydrolase YtcJ